MYYLQSRYYNPEMGRFISSDDAAMSMNALEDITAANLFAYCGNDPVNNLDSSGYYKIKNFNCYAYAMGINNKWLLPGGKFAMPRYYTVEQVAKWVISDFGSKKVRIVKNKNSKLKVGEYLVAVRVSIYVHPVDKNFIGPPSLRTYDFHFWKKSPYTNTWWEKRGETAIRYLGYINPDATINWRLGKIYYSGNKWLYGKRISYITAYYNSKTIYLAVQGNFWSK